MRVSPLQSETMREWLCAVSLFRSYLGCFGDLIAEDLDLNGTQIGVQSHRHLRRSPIDEAPAATNA
jgi:hypothetical protein